MRMRPDIPGRGWTADGPRQTRLRSRPLQVRSGITKPTLAARKAKRRKQRKAARSR
jgi:hypothetical protein